MGWGKKKTHDSHYCNFIRSPILTNPINYGEGFDPSGANDSFSISRPPIELPDDVILFGDESTSWAPARELVSTNTTSISNNIAGNGGNGNKRKSSNTNSVAGQRDVVMRSTPAPAPATVAPLVISFPKKNAFYSSSVNKTNVAIMPSSSPSADEEEEYIPTSAPSPSSSKRSSVYKNIPPPFETAKGVLPESGFRLGLPPPSWLLLRGHIFQYRLKDLVPPLLA